MNTWKKNFNLLQCYIASIILKIYIYIYLMCEILLSASGLC